MKSITSILLPLVSLALAASHSTAADWPQWRGLDRQGVSKETGLLKQWPADGPKLLWQVKDLDDGYSTPSVAGGRIYVMSNKGLEDESVRALNFKDGSHVWSTRIGKVGNPEQSPKYPGARSTPTVDGQKVYAFGSDGDLACLEAGSGKILWSKNVRKDFGGQPGVWAYSESPLVDGDVVVCAPGGADATVVAFNKNTGEVVWKSAVPDGDKAGYSSIVTTETGGVKQYLVYTAGGLIGLEAKTGKFLWRYAKTKGSSGMSIITPVIDGDIVYTGAGRVGGGAIKLTADQGSVKAEQIYFDTKLPTAIGGAVLVNGYLYGSGGQNLVCVEFKSGQVKWSERTPAPGSLCYADGRLYFHGENGVVLLIEANPEAYKETGRVTPPNPPTMANAMEKSWAYPIIADGCLLLRNKESLWCYDVRDKGNAK